MVDYENEAMKYSGVPSAFMDILLGARAKKWCILKNLKIQSVLSTNIISHFAKVTVEYLNAFSSYSLNYVCGSLIEWVVNWVSMEIMSVAVEITSQLSFHFQLML